MDIIDIMSMYRYIIWCMALCMYIYVCIDLDGALGNYVCARIHVRFTVFY